MQKTIYKYHLTPTDINEREMPAGAKILSVGVQKEDIFLWAIVNPDAKKEKRRFYVVGTGHPMPENHGRFLGTVHLYDSRLILHIFEG